MLKNPQTVSANKWVSYWVYLETTPMNLVGARLLQVGVGLTILFRWITELRFTQYFYGPEGVGMGSTVGWLGNVGFQVDAWAFSYYGVWVWVGLWGLGALGLVLGYQTRVAACLALVGYLFAETRSITHDGGDNILRIVLLFMVFLLDRSTLQSIQTPNPTSRVHMAVFVHNLAVLAIYAQICLLYMVSGSTKLSGEVWFNGTALYYVSHVDWFAPPWAWLQEAYKNAWIVTLGTYAALLYQVGFPFMLLHRWHIAWVVLGIGFHLGIGVSMGLVSFSMAMIALIMFTLRDSEWAKLQAWSRQFSRNQTQILYIDGFCRHCVAIGQAIGRLDWLGNVEIRSFRHEDSFRQYGITPAQMEKAMHLVKVSPRQNASVDQSLSVNSPTQTHPNGHTLEIRSGYTAVVALGKALPILWLVYPGLLWAQRLGLGERLYTFLAKNRKVVPDSSLCLGSTDSCALNPNHSTKPGPLAGDPDA
jgi:predicted DCC family thiol-disulfide oxidoreductase YuxK